MTEDDEKEAQKKAVEGKRTPIAREPRVATQQNGEVEPLRKTAKKQAGTDESKGER